ncbi:hypothetical protein ACOMHN_022148 [Nucella lapillus]
MASTHFCPEEPRPLAVISESYRDDVKERLPELPAWERYSLGEEYERELFALLHQYLELSTTDTLCYVGDTRDHLVHRLKDHFCLTKPVQIVLPGQVHYAETKEHKMLPINIHHVGAEEFFRQQVWQADRGHNPVKFDKILVHDVCRNLSQPTVFYANLMECLKPGGILLLLHRPGCLSTLPVFKSAKNRLADNDVAYMDIIHDLYSIPHMAVHWQLESVPVRIRKRKWLAMVRDRYPPHMQVMSTTEVLGGLRELSEGVLKYEGDQVEFDDCLLFARITRSSRDSSSKRESSTKAAIGLSRSHQSSPLHQRQPVPSPERGDLKLKMAMPPQDTARPRPTTSASPASFKFLWD